MREDGSLCRLGEESAAEPAVRGVPNRSKDYPATSTSVEIIRLDSRRSLLHSGHFEAAQSDVLQRQERQIVQSRLNLDDFLPWFTSSVLRWANTYASEAEVGEVVAHWLGSVRTAAISDVNRLFKRFTYLDTVLCPPLCPPGRNGFP